MNVQIESTWKERLQGEFSKPYFEALTTAVRQEYTAGACYPPGRLIFNAFNLCPFDKVKVVIIGQDPYHEPGQAHGLAFSVPDGIAIPPSLRNIYEEIRAEYGGGIPKSGNLESWAKQGVLLMNTVLTVRAHQANSHAGKGWELFTDAVLKAVGELDRPMVYLLWGSNAQKKAALIENPNHLVLRTSHPSPLSVYRGFRGCGHFRQCNDYLAEHELKPVHWALNE